MTIGTMFFGAVKKVEGQYIETKFLVIGIPLVPITSMLVTGGGVRSRTGYEIEPHTESIIAGYTRVIFGVACFTCLLLGWLLKEDKTLLWGCALLIPALYFNLVYGKASQEEIAERSKMGHAIGLYVLPEWFDRATQSRLCNHTTEQYAELYDVSDWKQEIDKPDLDNDQLKLLYAIAAFNYHVSPTTDNRRLLTVADQRYTDSGQVYF